MYLVCQLKVIIKFIMMQVFSDNSVGWSNKLGHIYAYLPLSCVMLWSKQCLE